MTTLEVLTLYEDAAEKTRDRRFAYSIDELEVQTLFVRLAECIRVARSNKDVIPTSLLRRVEAARQYAFGSVLSIDGANGNILKTDSRGTTLLRG